MRYVVESAQANIHLRETLDPTTLVVLPSTSNEWLGNFDVLTYDGIDINAARVVEEIDAEILRIQLDGGRVVRMSLVGYSMGGLVARYVIGLLYARGFFALVEPINFATFASPAVGIPAHQNWTSRGIHALARRYLPRTGFQLYGSDRFIPNDIFASPTLDSDADSLATNSFHSSLFSTDTEEYAPLLSVLSDPRFSFFKALSTFRRIDIYANRFASISSFATMDTDKSITVSVNDQTVTYCSGAIELSDPFAAAAAWAKKIQLARGEELNSRRPIDYAAGGLEM